MFITAPENIAWLLNIRGFDNPNSPIPNCRLLINDRRQIYIITEKEKLINLLKEKKINKDQVIDKKNFEKSIHKFKKGKIIIDKKTCSLFFENLLKKKFKILKTEDPIYFFKAIKNESEIKHMINTHILDGVALTRFLY